MNRPSTRYSTHNHDVWHEKKEQEQEPRMLRELASAIAFLRKNPATASSLSASSSVGRRCSADDGGDDDGEGVGLCCE